MDERKEGEREERKKKEKEGLTHSNHSLKTEHKWIKLLERYLRKFIDRKPTNTPHLVL